MSKRVAILGCTGSIGRQALDVIDYLNRQGQRFEVVALTAHQDETGLARAAQRWPKAATVLTSHDGREALEDVAAGDCDVVLHAVLGAAGVRASFAAAKAGKRIALANKESLVVGGRLLTKCAADHEAELIPVDSEHSAIFQAMLAGRRSEVSRVLLTASGGPFRTWPADRIATATVEEALAHPTWDMGGAITIGSATLFNKALEIIEAAMLFDLDPGEIEVVVHPQSVVHSMVEFDDGSTIAKLSPPDMKLPIGYALTYPDRLDGGAKRMDWSAAQSLDFEPADAEKFPSLRLAVEALAGGAGMPTVLNAANEIAVAKFLGRKLSFGAIAAVVEQTMAKLATEQGAALESPGSLDDLLSIDAAAREVARDLARELAGSAS